MIRFIALFALLLTARLSCAQSTDVPSEASVDKLLEVTNVRATIADTCPRVWDQLQDVIQPPKKGMARTPEQQAIFDKVRSQLFGYCKDLFSWEKLHPIYMQNYRGTFTQSEIDGMLAFYKSPAGKAMIAKMPLVRQKSASNMRVMMEPVLQKILDAPIEPQPAAKPPKP